MTAVAEPGTTDSEPPRLRADIDSLDTEILAVVRRRVALERRIGQLRVGTGAPRVTHAHDMSVIRRYAAELGEDGTALALVLLRLR
ncbi:putative chorismate mutase [Rhodococcus ruber BKS 20-38]|uniref:Putative chorismate mutase n=1 Tax=Rhodococcus ruber BKS 20-38 TaxID=1278076 RepID=M2ZYJ9_9NOCA|nr:chorismate mutase [Rhodococcus ruber]EME65778.1 putative chorismate mutase [Rhodococcus ruber BKS 20-38]